MPARKKPRAKPRPTTNDQLAARRDRVADLAARGLTQYEIAAELGIGQTTVHRDMVEVRRLWAERSSGSLQAIKDRQLAILDAVQQEALRGWRRSLETATKRVKREKGTKGSDKPSEIEATLTEEAQAGDPRFLEVVVRTSERICRLMGVDDPDKIAFTTPDGEPAAAGNTQQIVVIQRMDFYGNSFIGGPADTDIAVPPAPATQGAALPGSV